MSDKLKELNDEYVKLMHAVQTGIAYKIQIDPKFCTQKDLRVGVDSNFVSNGALCDLLVQKGVFTAEEYYENLVKFARIERDKLQKELSERYGTNIVLH